MKVVAKVTCVTEFAQFMPTIPGAAGPKLNCAQPLAAMDVQKS